MLSSSYLASKCIDTRQPQRPNVHTMLSKDTALREPAYFRERQFEVNCDVLTSQSMQREKIWNFSRAVTLTAKFIAESLVSWER